MIVHVLLKAPVDLPGAWTVAGSFGSATEAEGHCRTPGEYMIAETEVGRLYQQGTLLNVVHISVPNLKTPRRL